MNEAIPDILYLALKEAKSGQKPHAIQQATTEELVSALSDSAWGYGLKRRDGEIPLSRHYKTVQWAAETEIKNRLSALEAERQKVQVLRDALEQVAWKLEHKGDTPNGIQWAKIDRNDAAMSQVREALAATEGSNA